MKQQGGDDESMLKSGGSTELSQEIHPYHKREAVYTILRQYKVYTHCFLNLKHVPIIKGINTRNLKRSEDLSLLQKYPFSFELPTDYLLLAEKPGADGNAGRRDVLDRDLITDAVG